jgi:hypothetical protein
MTANDLGIALKRLSTNGSLCMAVEPLVQVLSDVHLRRLHELSGLQFMDEPRALAFGVPVRPLDANRFVAGTLPEVQEYPVTTLSGPFDYDLAPRFASVLINHPLTNLFWTFAP